MHSTHDTFPRVLIITSVPAEQEAVINGLNGDTRSNVIVSGVGMAASAARTMQALHTGNYEIVISAGIGGGFAGQADVGSIVVANQIVAADFGAETLDGFISVDDLGLGSTIIPVAPTLTSPLMATLRTLGLSVTLGPVLTVATVTGTHKTATTLATRVPSAAAEAMEGYGVAIAAQACGVPVLELRSISNRVGPRHRQTWCISEALQALQVASQAFMEVHP